MVVKTNQEVEEIKSIGQVLSEILDVLLPPLIKPGADAADISDQIKSWLAERNVLSIEGFVIDGKKTLSPVHISIGDEIVHGNPSKEKKLTGIVKVDLVGFRNGLYADAARSFCVDSDERHLKIIDDTRRALDRVINEVRVGDYFSKISKTIEKCAKESGWFVCKELCGHGIGTSLHQYPPVYNFYFKEFFQKNDFVIPNNSLFAIEPIFLSLDSRIEEKSDSLNSKLPGCFSAHFEHTVLFGEKSNVALTSSVK